MFEEIARNGFAILIYGFSGMLISLGVAVCYKVFRQMFFSSKAE